MKIISICLKVRKVTPLVNRSLRGTEIFHELAEHVSLTIHYCQEAIHDKNWTESKVHPHYNLWFIRSGYVHVKIGDVSARAKPGDIVFFYPFVPYTAETEQVGCRFIYTHFTFGIGDHAHILADFHLAGIVPGQLIREECLLFRAREYICQKTYTIQEISSMLGYADPYTFSKAFKKYYQVPPSQFN
jgi:hypothetical protein